ncbi:hypothetical protein HS1genome_1908 [Sulfodiicoccus acidiphilus]|uniref:Uncharacterized protein n=1 Tax=Sulfodiicoccus acidiphilus TaxID=1670455 RepID=A0A348B5R7_9CREN|nr:antitoxin VapB family protein [Sulfodiicoccus acidiphilus]BBD73519.1 hypothetical protein HS1genome_1908 [Sulfodiicoccus acidiphilus]GGT92570.1 hypothetical protein GCM10007116_07910 [Sulfodiicoccus acidiphilus]
MVKVSKISVSEDTKRKLEREKGDRSWDEFLLTLLEEERSSEEVLRMLREVLSEEDSKALEEGQREVHEEFKLRP